MPLPAWKPESHSCTVTLDDQSVIAIPPEFMSLLPWLASPMKDKYGFPFDRIALLRAPASTLPNLVPGLDVDETYRRFPAQYQSRSALDAPGITGMYLPSLEPSKNTTFGGVASAVCQTFDVASEPVYR